MHKSLVRPLFVLLLGSLALAPAWGFYDLYEDVDDPLEAAEMAAMEDDYDRAREIMDDLLEKEDKNAAAYCARARYRAGAKEPVPAVLADFARALSLEPANTDFLKERASYLESVEKWDLAAADYQAWRKLDPKSMDPLWGLAGCAQGQKKWSEALALYDELAGLSEKPWEVIQARARTRRDMGDLAGALADAGRALAAFQKSGRSTQDSAYGNLLAFRGLIHCALKNYEAAKADYLKAKAANAVGGDVRTLRAQVHAAFFP